MSLQTVDAELFRFVNSTLRNSLFDQLMPFASGNAFFFPALLVVGVVLALRGGKRAWVCMVMLALILPLGDGLVTNLIKHAVARDRPFLSLPDVHLLVGRSGSGSMPSAHAANWFAATLILFVYYRRSAWVMLPCALLVALSRIYNGVHYPSDVAAGAILGAGYAAAGLWLCDRIWYWIGRRWFPLWWEKLPSLANPRVRPSPEEMAEEAEFVQPMALKTGGRGPAEGPPGTPGSPALPRTRGIAPTGFVAPHATLDTHWLRLGYIWIALLLVLRWVYVAGHTIQLSEDEAYQWLWSKHLAFSYYSKPPLIAYVQFLGTSIWGDTAFGVRFFAPLISAVISLAMLRFFARELNARAGFVLLLIMNAAPMLAAGAVLMTVDPLSVLFWTAAMITGWRAVQDKGTTGDWLWVGLWMGLGFLSKYTALFQWLSWVLFFILWAPARKQLCRPGPHLAFLINLVCALPVLIWNSEHDWITVRHVAEDAGAREAWHPSLRPLADFVGSELLLLNPVFLVALVWAAIAFWRRNRNNPKLVYFFSMGVPVFLVYLLLSFRSRVLPNWVAPSVIPLFCLMVAYWETRWRLGNQRVGTWLAAGLALGFTVVVFSHQTNLVEKITRHYLPVKLDPLHRVRDWDKTAGVIEGARAALLSEGKPVFVITDHYGLAGEISFYSPELKPGKEALVYFRSSPVPENQFYFWPGYTQRKGENALFVRELNRDAPKPLPAPTTIQQQFESVTDMGVSNVYYHDRFLLRPLQLFACRGLK